MPTDFGSDFSSAEDLDETRVASGVELVAQDAFWALQTPQNMGVMQDDAPHYGMDLLDEIGAVVTPAQEAALPDKIRNTLTNDPRIFTVNSTVTRIDSGGPAIEYDIAIHCETAEGPFDLVGTADAESVELKIKLLPEAGAT